MMKLSLSVSRFVTIPLLALALTACSDPGGEVVPGADTGGGGQDTVGGADTKGNTDTGPAADTGTTPNDTGTTPNDTGTTPNDTGTTPNDAGPTVTRVCTDAELTTFNTCIQACGSTDQTCQQGCLGGLSQACSSAYAALAQCSQAANCAADDAQCTLTSCPAEAAAVFGPPPAPTDCDPIAGTGCEANQQCTYVSQGELGCGPVGTAAIDEECQTSGCAAGACLSLDGTTYSCFQFCSPMANACPDGRPCNIGLQGTDDTFCGDLPQACNVFTQDCTAPEGCYVVDAQGNTDCSPNTGKTLGATCGFLNDCAPGLLCAGPQGASTCSTACNTDGSVPCTTGTCTGIGAGTYGVCVSG